MELKNEIQLNRTSYSQSCDDIFTMLELEIEETKDFKRNSFARQGAFRKRTIDMDINERESLFRSSILITGKDLDDEQVFQNKETNNVFPVTTIKEMIKSLKCDRKKNEKLKKKLFERNIDSSGLKTDDLDIQTFLHINGKEISEGINDSIILPESSWLEMVDESKIITKDEIKQQASILEIVETEAHFINQLNVVVHIFIPLLHKVFENYRNAFVGVDIDEIFGNINEVYTDHLNFWNTCISKLLFSKMKERRFDVYLMKEGFSNISTILGSYTYFMSAQPTIRRTIDKLQKRNCIFNAYIEWTQKYDRHCHDGCMCILSAPFQRITKYKLLLENVRKYSNKLQLEVVDEMIFIIHNFLQQVNSSVAGKYTMKEIKEKIIDANVSKNHLPDVSRFLKEEVMHFDILRPLHGFEERTLIHEGRLRLKECNSKTADVQCYLCNDLFVICKPITINWDKLKILKPPIRLDKLLVKEESEGCLIIIVFNDFKVVENVLTLTGDANEIKLWVNMCTKIKNDFMSQFTDPVSVPALKDNKDDIYHACHPRICMQSGTSSSGYSTYSNNSSFSQYSINSTLHESFIINDEIDDSDISQREKSRSV